MKINMLKLPGGVFAPADEIAEEAMNKFKSNVQYPVEVKRTRNPEFHGKVFSFFNFCFAHWDQSITYSEHMSESKQFDRFRKDLTILCGPEYYDQFVRLNGDTRIEAKSLSYGSMKQDEFELFYNALINAAMKHIFHKLNDQQLYHKLAGFF